MKAVALRIEGRVQGVGFRWACEDEATRGGLVGWVRNAYDGSVEAYAEGPDDSVDAFVAWCRQGPPAARVTGVAVRDVPAEGGDRFRTTY